MTTVGYVWRRLGMAHFGISAAILLYSVTFSPVYFDLLAPIATGQLMLIAIWVSFAKGPLVGRFMFALLLGPIVAAIGMNIPQWTTNVQGLVLVSLWGTLWTLIIVCTPIALLCSFGWQLTVATQPTTHARRWQFPLSVLLAITALVAMLLALQQLITSIGTRNDDGTIGFPNNSYAAFALIVVFGITGIGQSVAVLSAIWSCLTVDDARPRLLSTLFVIVLLCAVPMHISGGPAHLQWARMMATSLMTVVLSLLFLRYYGVRVSQHLSVRGLGTSGAT